MASPSNPFGALDKMLFAAKPQAEEKKPAKPRAKKVKRKKTVVSSADPSSRLAQSTKTVNQPGRLNRSTDRADSHGRSNQSTKGIDKTSQQLLGEVAKRPLSFYIPLSVNEKINEAVRYYQKKYHPKIDRSAVVSALLGNIESWKPSALDKLAPHVKTQLKNRFDTRLSSQLDELTNPVD